MINQLNQYIFNLYHYLLNLRDTCEYAIEREHTEEMFNTRKRVLTLGMQDGSALGNFAKSNEEQTKPLIEKLKEFVEDIYGDESTVLKVSEGKIRVDHTQHIRFFEPVVGLQESIRDIIYGYLNRAKETKESDPNMEEIMALDEKMTRAVFVLLIFKEYVKSFSEFQKAMGESKGQRTPQINYIIDNELSKLASMLTFSKNKCHATDAETLDILDDVEKAIEMTQGRRERPVDPNGPDGRKSFKEVFDLIFDKTNKFISKYEPIWKEKYKKYIDEIIEINNNNAAKNAAA